MALAILRFQGSNDSHTRFQVDIGSNRFYSYAIADSKIQSTNGLPLLQDPKYISPLIGPLPESSLGRTVLEVPSDRFDTKHRYIQIMSFRTVKRQGPALSEIVSVIPQAVVSQARSDDASTFALGLETDMDRQPIETVAFSYREEPPISSAMFLTALKGMATKLLPQVTQISKTALNTVKTALPAVADMIPTLLPLAGTIAGAVAGGAPAQGVAVAPGVGVPQPDGSMGGGMVPQPDGSMVGGVAVAPTGGIGTQLLQAAANPQVAEQIAALMRQLAAPKTAAAPVAVAKSLPSRNAPPLAVGTPERLAGESILPTGAVTPAIAYGLESSPYTEAMVLPALAAAAPMLMQALPALMPLLQQVLNPETIKTVMDNLPTNKLMGVATEGMKQVGSMIQESEKRQYDHLEKIMPSHTKADDINKMFQGMSLELAGFTPALRYRRLEGIPLKFEGLTTLTLHGRSRLLYRHDRDIAFPLSITTPKLIQTATLQLIVKNSTTLEILIEQKYPVEQVSSGPLKVIPKISQEQLRTLAPNEEYLVCIHLVWSGKSKQTGEKISVGTSISQLIMLVGEYCFNRVDGPADVIPLRDVEKHRSFWHKVWQGEFTHTRQQIAFDCKYYYVLEPERSAIARMETMLKHSESNQTQSGRLKTGLILNLDMLNDLISQISTHPKLEPAQLNALRSSEFKDRFNHCARAQVAFKGNSGNSVALWVYPEVKMQQVLLKKVERTNESGHVLELSEKPVRFPIPTVAHFVGAMS